MTGIKTLFTRYKELILYVVFGGLTTLVNFVLYFGLTKGIHVNYLAANTIAWVGAVIFAFVTNKFYVFEAHEKTAQTVAREFILFTGSRFLSFLIETGLLFVGVSLLKAPDGPVKIAVAVIVVILNYFFTKFVFKKDAHAHRNLSPTLDAQDTSPTSVPMNASTTPWYKSAPALYTAGFFALALCIFLPLIKSHTSLVCNIDGLPQHYFSSIYYTQYLKDFLTGGGLKLFDTTIGLGQDVLTSLHYYVLGDPLALLYLFAPTKAPWLMYGFVTLLRLFLAGGAFLLFSRKMGLGKTGRVVGGLVYAFCAFALTYGVRHPFFINAMIYLPLMLLGIEKILRGEKKTLFTVMVFLGAISNFYFLFSNSLVTLAYATARVYYRRTSLQDFWKTLGRRFLECLGCYLLGIALSAFILVPVLTGFFNASREAFSRSINLWWYESSYYFRLLATSMSDKMSNHAATTGLTSVGLMAIVLLFTQRGKKETYLKSTIGVFFVMFLVPLSSYVFNGTAHTKNRWSFMAALVVAFVIGYELDRFAQATRRQKITITIASIVYGAALAFFYSVIAGHSSFGKTYTITTALIFLVLGIIALWALKSSHEARSRTAVLVLAALCLMQIGIMGYQEFSPRFGNYKKSLIPVKQLKTYERNTPAKTLAKLNPQTDTYRVDALFTYPGNYGLSMGLGGINSFFSLQPHELFALSRAIGNAKAPNNSIVLSYDRRLVATALSGTSYYMMSSNNNRIEPSASTPIARVGRRTVAHNDLALGMFFTYDKQTDVERFNAAEQVEREQMLADGVHLTDAHNATVSVLPEDDGAATSRRTTLVLSDAQLNSALEQAAKDSSGVIYKDHKIYAKKKHASLTLTLDVPQGREFTASFSKLAYDTSGGPVKNKGVLIAPKPKAHLQFWIKDAGSKEKARKNNTTLYSPANDYYVGPRDYVYNLGTTGSNKITLEIELTGKGVYSFDSFVLKAVDLAQTEQALRSHKANLDQPFAIDNNKVTVGVTAQRDSVGVIALPWSRGWQATVNGKTVPVYKANLSYMGVPLSKGTNKIVLTYQTPGLKAGFLITAITTLFLMIVLFMQSRRKRTHTEF